MTPFTSLLGGALVGGGPWGAYYGSRHERVSSNNLVASPAHATRTYEDLCWHRFDVVRVVRVDDVGGTEPTISELTVNVFGLFRY